MELKLYLWVRSLCKYLSLLIVPYGIETCIYICIILTHIELLIVPYGIETSFSCNGQHGI